MQWKLPDKLSTFVQRAGRAARRKGTAGLAVLLVEPSAYTVKPDSVSPSAEGSAATQSTRRRVGGVGKRPRAAAGWAKEHGRRRGEYSSGAGNDISRAIKLLVQEDADDEGLIALVQTGDCRRRVMADAFGQRDTSEPTALIFNH